MARFFPVLFLVLLLTATEFGPRVAEARQCDSASHRFKGTCLANRNCAAVCNTEGFHSGYCGGLRRRCLCARPCPAE
ncbi:hypothetical protein ACHQM5_005259 [Ranunculus cassubicifolius]